VQPRGCWKIMTRITDALKRARASALAPLACDERAADAIQFFAPGQPAVAIPWKLHEESCAARRDDASTGLSEAGQARPVKWNAPTAWPSTPQLVVSPEINPGTRDQLRRLAAMLLEAQHDHHIKVIVVTSATEGDGKTLTMVNLALTLSEFYERRVLLIDADVQRPSVHALLRTSNARGLADALSGVRPLPAIKVSEHLSVLTAGTSHDDPLKALVSDRLRVVVEMARSQYDWVLIDAAPGAHATTVASTADVALLVVRSGQTPYDAARRAAEVIGVERIFGVVLNHARVGPSRTVAADPPSRAH
jgi:Mrp family chromosome partitioning ATPase